MDGLMRSNFIARWNFFLHQFDFSKLFLRTEHLHRSCVGEHSHGSGPHIDGITAELQAENDRLMDLSNSLRSERDKALCLLSQRHPNSMVRRIPLST